MTEERVTVAQDKLELYQIVPIRLLDAEHDRVIRLQRDLDNVTAALRSRDGIELIGIGTGVLSAVIMFVSCTIAWYNIQLPGQVTLSKLIAETVTAEKPYSEPEFQEKFQQANTLAGREEAWWIGRSIGSLAVAIATGIGVGCVVNGSIIACKINEERKREQHKPGRADWP